MTIGDLGRAAAMAALLAAFGGAEAQSPGTSNNTAGLPNEGQKEQTTTEEPGVRSGWSGRNANRAGDASAREEDATGVVRDPQAGTAAGSQGSAATAGAAQRGGKVDEDLSEKIQEIHASNRTELHMAQMGQTQATSPEVKEYARRLQQDHERFDQQLAQAARSAGVQLEGKAFQEKQRDAQKDMQKLQGKSGQEFDREYVSMMVDDHEKDIKAVKKAAKDAREANQAELASTLDQAVATMQGHLDQAKQLKDTVGKGRRGGTSTGSGSAGSTEASGDRDKK